MRRALVVGIDSYAVGDFERCGADARSITTLLAEHRDGTPNWSTTLFVGAVPIAGVTANTLRVALCDLFSDCVDDDVLFFFAGYVGATPWGTELMAQDTSRHCQGISMNDLITLANDSNARSATLVLNCYLVGGRAESSSQQNLGLATIPLRDNVALLAVTRAVDSSREEALGRVLLDGLAGAASERGGDVSLLSLFSYVVGAIRDPRQRPGLIANLSESVVLRRGAPSAEPVPSVG